MDLYKYIYTRKANRDFIMEPLTQTELNKIEEKIVNIGLLFENAPIKYRFINETKGMFQVEAPHYLVLGGYGNEGEQENVGFVGQQLTLWLNAQNIGCVWLGASKDAKDHSTDDIVMIAFGKSNQTIFRESTEFKRKELEEITNIPHNKFIKAAHIAPSGMNLQPWYFERNEDKLVIYRQILKPPTSLAYKLTKVDIGIVMAHFYLAYQHHNKDFNLITTHLNMSKKGYHVFGYIDFYD